MLGCRNSEADQPPIGNEGFRGDKREGGTIMTDLRAELTNSQSDEQVMM